MKAFRTAFAVWAIGWSVTIASAQDWPQWRGEHRDGKAIGFKAPETWPRELAQKWKVTVGEGDAGPALAGERVFVFSRQDGQEVTRCLNATDGKELWQDKYEAPGWQGPDSGHAGPRSTPVIADGKVVTMGVLGKLSCLDAKSGGVLWRKDDYPGAWPRFHVAMSPLVFKQLCIALVGKPSEGGIVAYHLDRGEAAWKWTGDGPAYASPVLGKVDGTDVVVAMTDKKVVCLAAADGRLMWETPFAPQGMAYNAATPILDGQTLIYCGQGRGTVAVKLARNGDAVTAAELWKNPDNAVQFNTPVLKDGFLYGLSARSEIVCLDATDGRTAWTAPLMPQEGGAEAPPAGGGGGRGGRMGRTAGYGSIIDAGSVLLMVSPTMQLVVLKPDTTGCKEVARIKVADTPVFAHPAVSGNRLFLKDQDSLALWVVP